MPDQTSRRIVTVLFSDIVGSTELGEQLDPEALRAVLGDYFAAMRVAIERHGGTVEKFIGDAIMAVFGLTAIHEDDALRAVRAALEMREALSALNAHLAGARGLTIAMRTGIHSGEVAAGDARAGQLLATGDAVNSAARLEQAAKEGEILLTDTTVRLVRDAVVVEEVPAILAKGKAQPLRAYRLVGLRPRIGPLMAGPTARLVGREPELRRLRTAYARVRRSGRSLLVTISGPAGVGKSRLLGVFLARRRSGNRVLIGRCLPYGEGITYWPIREIFFDAAGIRDTDSPGEATARLERLMTGARDAEVVSARIASAVGLSDAPASQAEIFWAIRRALEHLSSGEPSVLVVEDLQWAEPTLLQLIEYLEREGGSLPVLMVGLTRPELFDREPARAGPSRTEIRIDLEGLDAFGATELIAATPGGASMPAGLRARIIEAADGNPLFITEMVGLVVERAAGEPAGVQGDRVAIPPTIQALMAARVDGLPDDERSVTRRASVQGQVFEEVALVAMTPAASRPVISSSLAALLRRELISPSESALSVAEAYRFRHILLHDAAYDSLTKADRADLHERFAAWLERAAGERLAEFEEILGFHLAQAHRYRLDLRLDDEQTRVLGSIAGEHLVHAARRARERGDGLAASRLAARSMALPARDGRSHAAVLLEVGLIDNDLGHLSDARGHADEALAEATRAGDRALASRARRLRLEVVFEAGAMPSDDPSWEGELAAILGDAEASTDPATIGWAWYSIGQHEWAVGRGDQSEVATRRALAYARKAGDVRLSFDAEADLLSGAVPGPTPASVVAGTARDLMGRSTLYPTIQAEAQQCLAVIEAQLLQFADARRDAEAAIATLVELAQWGYVPHARTDLAWILKYAGDHRGAEEVLRLALGEARLQADGHMASFISCRLAEVLLAQGQFEDAVGHLAEAERYPISVTRSRIMGARARIMAHAGDQRAAGLVDELLQEIADYRSLIGRAEGYRDAAMAMADLGDSARARTLAAEGIGLAQAKEDLALARQIEGFVDGLPPD